jgi:Protein of unknown function (DUF3108)
MLNNQTAPTRKLKPLLKPIARGFTGMLLGGMLSQNLYATTITESMLLDCPTPKPFNARYDTPQTIPINASAHIQLTMTGPQQFRYESKVSALWQTQTEVSTFLWSKQSLKALSYSQERKGFGRKKASQILFDIPQKKVTFSKDGTQTEHTLQGFTVDMLTEQLLVGCLIHKGLTAFEIPTFTKGQFVPHRFEVKQKETLTIAEKPHPTIRVEKVHNSKDRTTTLWFSQKNPYLLVKIEQKDKRKKYTLLLKTVSGI